MTDRHSFLDILKTGCLCFHDLFSAVCVSRWCVAITDIDECSLPPTFADAARCKESEVCVDTSGGYECECKAGYQKEEGECVNIDECQDGNRCHPKARCVDNVGSYSCECEAGYAGNGKSCVGKCSSCCQLLDIIVLTVIPVVWISRPHIDDMYLMDVESSPLADYGHFGDR